MDLIAISTLFEIIRDNFLLRNLSSEQCNLENILLSHRSNFPWAKICDFGYARVISNGHFSKGLIGTVAYLAPEVLQKKCYNRSVDMWAIGVILYVTLSGTFPFNEGDDITDQLNNRHFMFPADPWREISPLSVNLILSLLRIEVIIIIYDIIIRTTQYFV